MPTPRPDRGRGAPERDKLLYIATVHYRSPRWVAIQTGRLRRHIPVEHRIWTSLERIDPRYGSYFDRVLEQRGSHAGKLNHLASEISLVAEDDDLLMFIDGDAFPVADPMPLIGQGLAEAPLTAVRRSENADEPQPHPSFCVTSVGLWRTLPGDWTAGYTWTGAHGNPNSDVGGNLLRRLEATGTPWTPILRTNRVDLDPLYFGLYGGAIYHHGAGFRPGELSPAHRARAPRPLPVPRFAPLRLARDAVSRLRWRRWEARTTRAQLRESERVYARIAAGGDDWLDELA
jgi:hypothetical protein